MPAPLLAAVLVGCGQYVTPIKTDSEPVVSGDDTAPDTGDPPSGIVEHVVVLVLDGARIDESFGDGTSTATGGETEDLLPTLRSELFPQGTLVLPAVNTGITITAPGHCDLFTGVRQPFANFPNSSGPGSYLPELPTIFEAIRTAYGSGAEDAQLLANTVLVEPTVRSLYPGLGDAATGGFSLVTVAGDDTLPSEDDREVISAVWSAMQASEPRFIAANLHDIDRTAHYAADPAAYPFVITRVDDEIVDFWASIQADERFAGNTLLVLVADHGRHRLGLDEDWRQHGDHCAGCREIPLFLVGPGIRAGARVESGATLEDMGRTLAWTLGVELPYTSGRLLTDILEEPPTVSERSGDVWPAASGGVQASQGWLDDPAHRSEVVVDGEVLSDAEAFAAEAPRLVEAGADAVACWRELHLPDGETLWPWTGQCRRRSGGAWSDLEFPISPVSPLWDPALHADSDGALWMASVDNPNGSVSDGAIEQAVRLLRWTSAAGWEGQDEGDGDVSFPTGPSLLPSGTDTLVAFATSDGGDAGRETRHVVVERVSWPDGGLQTWTPIYDGSDREDAEGTAWYRVERPALRGDGSAIWMAVVGAGDAGTSVLLTRSEDSGGTWSDLERLDATGRVLAHVSPVWQGEAVLWARLADGGTVEICRASDGPAECVDTGSPRILGLAVGDAGPVASLDDGSGEWAIASVAW